jgi:hypothetical protein
MVLLCGLMVLGCGQHDSTPPGKGLHFVSDIAGRRAQFVEQSLTADVSHLSSGDREALKHLVEAARAMDEIFWLQAWAGNPEFEPDVVALQGEGAEAARNYYRIMYGPWDRLVHNEPFLGTQPHPDGAGYYPEDMTAAEFEAWLEAHPSDREAFTSLFTIIRREGEGLTAVPYSAAYRELLAIAADELRAAARATDNESLRRFLELRAEAFMTDDYYASDVAWMDLDSDIEVVIGPYETYEDHLFGYKAAFESFVCVAQPEDSARLEVFKSQLPFLERNLPIPDEHKNFDRGSESPIRVVDELFTAGDTRAGVQTIAFNLPNDERVREEKGSKKVLLKNVMRAKYDAILTPIAGRVLPADEADLIDFEAFYQFTLHHELSHGIGPGVESGVMSPEILDSLPWTYTAGMFRTTRFGVAEAHGLGMVLQANFLLEKGAVDLTEDGRFRPVPELFEASFRDLAHELLMIQALGDYEAAIAFVERYGTVHPAMVAAIEALTDLPVDVDPSYPLEGLQ